MIETPELDGKENQRSRCSAPKQLVFDYRLFTTHTAQSRYLRRTTHDAPGSEAAHPRISQSTPGKPRRWLPFPSNLPGAFLPRYWARGVGYVVDGGGRRRSFYNFQSRWHEPAC
jgi:hypothetical protein